MVDGTEYEGQAVDISFSGICVNADRTIEPRSTVDFQVWAVLPDRETNPITMPARIVWCTPVEGRMQIGAAFDRNMDNRAWTRLDVLLQLLAGNMENVDRA
jgi:hypothetical protein